MVQNSYYDPSVTVDPVTVTAAVEGGTYGFSYTVSNPVSNGVAGCSADVDWISGIECPGDGTVTFTVAANDEEELRSGEIALTYSWTGGSVSETVTVVQDHDGGIYPTVADLIGTYEITGSTFYTTGWARDTTWTMRIFPDPDDPGVGPTVGIIIDGITPMGAGRYPEDDSFVLRATYNYSNTSLLRITFTSQFTGGMAEFNGVDYYIGYIPILKYIEGEGSVYYPYDSPLVDIICYYQSDGSWLSSTYGIMLTLFRNTDTFTSAAVSWEIINPGISFRRIFPATNSLPTASAAVPSFVGTLSDSECIRPMGPESLSKDL